jgi:hypothetical protein
MIRKITILKNKEKYLLQPFNDEFKCNGQNAPKPCGNW